MLKFTEFLAESSADLNSLISKELDERNIDFKISNQKMDRLNPKTKRVILSHPVTVFSNGNISIINDSMSLEIKNGKKSHFYISIDNKKAYLDVIDKFEDLIRS